MSQYGPPGGPYPGEQPDRWPERRQPSEPYREPSDPWGGPPGPWGDAPTEAPGQQWPGGAQPDWSTGQPPPAGPDWQGYGQHTSAGDQNWHSPNQPAQGWAGADDQTWQQSGGDQPWQQPGGGQQPYPDSSQQHPAATPAWEPAAEPRRSGRGGLSGGLLAVLIGLTVLLCGGGAAGIYVLTRDETPDTGVELTAPTPEPDEAPSTAPSEQPEPTAEVDQPSPTPTPTSSNDARFVDVGQCVRNEAEAEEETPVLTITDCDSGAYEVLARFDGVTDGEEDAKTKCADVEGYTNWYFFNSQLDALDFVLCLRQR